MEIRVKEIEIELDAFDIYSIYREQKNLAFLDSNGDFKQLGKYSFIGLNPFLVFKGRLKQCYINDVLVEGDAFEKLRELIEKYKAENTTDLPMIGGCIGYFSYDYGLGLEGISTHALEDVELAHFCFIFYDNLLIFDHENKKKYLSACGILSEAKESLEKIEGEIKNQGKVEDTRIKATTRVECSSNFTKEGYMEAVEKMRDYICSGDMYIANMTQRFTATTHKDAYEIYKDLRKINPAPFSALMRLEDIDIISSSPERFLKIYQGVVETRPIKGTRPRGKTPKEDAELKNQLLHSEKDKSELLMIVDLERNDLSKVCKPHHVKVTELFQLEEYASVFHLVATIRGELKEDVDALDCFKACFPGGSITGAPKIRAMEIIDELEGLKRGLYTGCLGYFSFDGNGDFNIMIRSILKKENQVYFGAGGGITWESCAAEEYQETLDKAKALMAVIG